MSNPLSLSAALDKLALAQDTSTTPGTPSRPRSQRPRSGIMQQWQHDRFDEDTTRIAGPDIIGQWELERGMEKSRADSCDKAERRHVKSTVSDWQAFGQFNTSGSRPGSAKRDGNVRRGGQDFGREDWRGRNEGVELIGPSTQPHALPIPLQRLLSDDLFSPQNIHQDQALRKRKSGEYLGRNGEVPVEEPHRKRASSGRLSPPPLTAAFAADDRRCDGVLGPVESLPLARRPGFERCLQRQTRSRHVAPNGTTILPFASPRHATSPSTCPQVTLRHGGFLESAVPQISSSQQALLSTCTQVTPRLGITSAPVVPLRSSIHHDALHTCLPQPPSFPAKPVPSVNHSTPAAVAPPPSPSKSRPKTDDSTARRILGASLGMKIPKRTEEEIKRRQEDQEKRRLQREERDKMSHEELAKWRGTPAVKVKNRPAAQPVVKVLAQTKTTNLRVGIMN